jgi:chemotaxis protein MotA
MTCAAAPAAAKKFIYFNQLYMRLLGTAIASWGHVLSPERSAMKTSAKAPVKAYAREPVMGACFGVLLVLSAIALNAHSFLAFFSLEGVMIVGGGVVAVAFMSFAADDVHKALDAIKHMFRQPRMTHETLHRDMTDILRWARIVREKSMRELETNIGRNGIDDPFVKYGLNMAVSQYAPDEVRAMMETAADAAYERDAMPVEVLQAMASHAPAFGMVGTLVGMVAMLCTLSGDVTGIGPSLAVSFLSTLYGVLSARMIYMPAAAKLRQDVEMARFRNHLITEGLVMLVAGKTPMYIQDHLNSFLRPEIHDYFSPVIYRHPAINRQPAPVPAVPLAQQQQQQRLKAVGT